MYFKKLKRKCGVRGCKNTDNVFVISRNRELGHSIIICRDCMAEALNAADNYVVKLKPAAKVKEDKPLFPHPESEFEAESESETVSPAVPEFEQAEIIERTAAENIPPESVSEPKKANNKKAKK